MSKTNLFIPNVAGLTAEQCPVPDLSEVGNEVHSLICGISEASLERDSVLLAELQTLKRNSAALDPEGVAKTLADFKEFLESADKDGNGLIDGLAGLISTSKELTIKVESLTQRADVVDQRLNQVSNQATLTAEQSAKNAKDIEALKNAEDKTGITQEVATAIAKKEAQEAACRVATAVTTAAQGLVDSLKTIDCGKVDHSNFLIAAANGTDFTPTTPNGGGSTTTSSTSSESVTTETTETSSTSSTTESSSDSVVDGSDGEDTAGAQNF